MGWQLGVEVASAGKVKIELDLNNRASEGTRSVSSSVGQTFCSPQGYILLVTI